MTEGNAIKDKMIQDAGSEVKVRIFTNNTKPPSKTLLNRSAMIFMAGFNNAPWDIYGFNYTAERAEREFTVLASMVINSYGALISLTHGRTPAGFSVVTCLDIFLRELKKVAGCKRLPRDYKSPDQYFETLSQIIGVPLDKFGTIGYIADVALDNQFQGKGYGKILIKSSLKYLKDSGKKYALAWTVNPMMAGILSKEGFKYIHGIGHKGEGVDCLVDNGIWFPTLVTPPKNTIKQPTKSAAARHYLKEL